MVFPVFSVIAREFPFLFHFALKTIPEYFYWNFGVLKSLKRSITFTLPQESLETNIAG